LRLWAPALFQAAGSCSHCRRLWRQVAERVKFLNQGGFA
jgi:hypothetical protein